MYELPCSQGAIVLICGGFIPALIALTLWFFEGIRGNSAAEKEERW